ncbi:helix-turn-helix domain-containing protein [Candidatus Uhrbacteria bacterium]|nr:helix-turn-helix domain-containing protein [Candidatus Uhrbacteria bacterium]
MASKRTIIALLHNLGFTDNEAKCYLAALSLGDVPVQAVAKSAGVNRSNAYAAVRSLIERGLVYESIHTGAKRIQAAPAESLRDFARKRQKQATKLRWKVEDLVPMLSALSAGITDQARILVLQGSQTFTNLKARSLQIVSDGDEMREIDLVMQADARREIQEFDEQVYIPRRVAKGCYKRTLCVGDEWNWRSEKENRGKLRELRFLPEQIVKQLEMSDVNIYADEVTFYWQSPQPIGLIIQSQKISDIMRTLFDIMWSQTPPADSHPPSSSRLPKEGTHATKPHPHRDQSA